MKKLLFLILGIFLIFTEVAVASEVTGTINTNDISTGIQMSIPCPTWQHLNTTFCESDIRACTITNWVGQQTRSAWVWWTCTVSSCNSWYVVSSNTCVRPSGWGWGGWFSNVDNCPDWDKSGNLYDYKCDAPTSTWSTTWSSNSWSSVWGWSNTSCYSKSWSLTNIIFPDIEDSFAKEDIIDFVSKWIINWFKDGTFRPNDWASRAEFLAIVMKTFCVNLTSTWTNIFTDIPADWPWMIPYIIKANELGIIWWQVIDGKKVFRPNDKISRIEALAIVFKVTKFTTKSTKLLEFNDEFLPWMTPYVIKWKELWLANGQMINGKLMFRPNDSISRAEAVRIINNAFKLYNKFK